MFQVTPLRVHNQTAKELEVTALLLEQVRRESKHLVSAVFVYRQQEREGARVLPRARYKYWRSIHGRLRVMAVLTVLAQEAPVERVLAGS